MAKILLIEKENWKATSRKTGEPINGVSYIGILDTGTMIKFTSKMDHDHALCRGLLAYDAEKAVDLDVRPKFFNGKVSYYEAVDEA